MALLFPVIQKTRTIPTGRPSCAKIWFPTRSYFWCPKSSTTLLPGIQSIMCSLRIEQVHLEYLVSTRWCCWRDGRSWKRSCRYGMKVCQSPSNHAHDYPRSLMAVLTPQELCSLRYGTPCPCVHLVCNPTIWYVKFNTPCSISESNLNAIGTYSSPDQQAAWVYRSPIHSV